MAEELTTPGPEENPLEPLTPPVISSLAESGAGAGAASLAEIQALLTLNHSQSREEIAALRESLAQMPVAVARALRIELEAAERAAEQVPEEALPVSDASQKTLVELENVPKAVPVVARRPRGLGLARR